MRYFLLLGMLAAQPTHPNRAYVRTGQAPFLHGVASGDPLNDRVVLWTRVTPPHKLDRRYFRSMGSRY